MASGSFTGFKKWACLTFAKNQVSSLVHYHPYQCHLDELGSGWTVYQSWNYFEKTLSPIIMVQWKTTLNERKLILEIHPFSTMIMGGSGYFVANLEDWIIWTWRNLKSKISRHDLTLYAIHIVQAARSNSFQTVWVCALLQAMQIKKACICISGAM